MNNSTYINANHMKIWKTIQFVVWLLGAGILLALFLQPSTGIDLFWNLLIPVAPAVVMILPGIWRNVCPISSTTQHARRIAIKNPIQIEKKHIGLFHVMGALLLLAIVPLRHIIFNTNGPATGFLLLAVVAIAILVSLFFSSKSGWCCGLCPILPVEKLYGFSPAFNAKNIQCGDCKSCVSPCPESSRKLLPTLNRRSGIEKMTWRYMAGGFVGFIWGWFQVKDYSGNEAWSHLGESYFYSLGGFVVTLLVFLALEGLLSKQHHDKLIRFFAASAIACYYWYRLPALIGLGLFPDDGVLIDLSGIVPVQTAVISQLLTTGLIFWFLFFRNMSEKFWTERPPLAADH